MRGDIKLELSGLNLMWTNGRLTQTAVMVNPEDKLNGNVSEAPAYIPLERLRPARKAERRSHPFLSFAAWWRDHGDQSRIDTESASQVGMLNVHTMRLNFPVFTFIFV